MIKKTLYFGNPCKLSKKDNQLQVELLSDKSVKTIPIEDIGLIVLDNYQIALSHALIMALIENNSAILSCNDRHLPEGLMLPMFEHHAFTEKVRLQVESSEPLRKNIWQHTIRAKILNQAGLLKKLGAEHENLLYWADKVRSGDPDNMEGRAAAYYWPKLFESLLHFKRGRFEDPPNNLLNYGYAVLRAVIARSLVASGLMTFMGVHHRNRYNPYCLADDIMEPFRPFVDEIVINIMKTEDDIEFLSPDIKKQLLIIPTVDVLFEGQKSPLMIASQRTTASLMKCYEGITKKILFPQIL